MVSYHAVTLPTLVYLLVCSTTDCQVYNYIKPSSSDSCSAQPCLTLSQLAVETSSYLHSETVLIFQRGKHSLNATLSIGNIVMLQFQTSVLPQRVKIMCEYFSRFDLYNITTVRIRSLEFIGCGGNNIKFVVHFLVENVSFLGDEYSSTALELVGTKAVIDKSSFTSNKVGKLRIYFVTGGAVVVSQSNVTITESTFK